MEGHVKQNLEFWESSSNPFAQPCPHLCETGEEQKVDCNTVWVFLH